MDTNSARAQSQGLIARAQQWIAPQQQWIAPQQQWIWIASIWFGFALVDAMDTVLVMRGEGMHHAWTKLFVTTMLSWLPWALSTAFVLQLGRRFPPVKLKPLVTWMVHLGACAAIGLIFSAWTTWLDLRLNPYAYSSAAPRFAH